MNHYEAARDLARITGMPIDEVRSRAILALAEELWPDLQTINNPIHRVTFLQDRLAELRDKVAREWYYQL